MLRRKIHGLVWLLLLLFEHGCAFGPHVIGRPGQQQQRQQLRNAARTSFVNDPSLSPPRGYFANNTIAESSSPLTAADPVYLSAVPGPSMETKPDYAAISGPFGSPLDYLFMWVFRQRLAAQVGADSPKAWNDFTAITDLAASMNHKYGQAEIQERAKQVLVGLFPPGMPSAYAKLFSKPLPEFSARMNAWATWAAGTWLMGECKVIDIDDADNGQSGIRQGLHVKRCRFLEESGCASVCVNSCKIPTQRFFIEEMGLPLTMEPNYDTFECQFSFGKTPTYETELGAKATPCLMRCPSVGAIRKQHAQHFAAADLMDATAATDTRIRPCDRMGD